VIPEYFIEYSIEGNKNTYMTKFERLALDIAYSNKLSHSNMPHIIGSLSSHFEASNNTRFGDDSIEEIEKKYPTINITPSNQLNPLVLIIIIIDF